MLYNKDRILAVQTDFVNGVPLIYYTKQTIEFNNNQYLAYRCNGVSEEVLVDETASNPLYSYSPIINIEKLPSLLSKNSRKNKRFNYIKIKVRDLASLAKVAAYKTIYDEPPLPLLVFKQTKSKKYIIGTALNLMESDLSNYFYYLEIENENILNFLRYSSQKNEIPIFTNNIENHGYIYLKVIKLLKEHPLISAGEDD